MASKLCCTTEQEGRPESPELPNARVSQAIPVNRPLLPKETASSNSRFTSGRSEDLHELRDIFNNAQDQADDGPSPTRGARGRFSRGSMYSLRSLHKMTSMRSIIRRKFSKDDPKKDLAVRPTRPKAKNRDVGEEPGTVVKQLRDGPNQQLNVTKDDLRKHLLSDKKPDEGGYDSDAEMLDDIATNLGKKTPGKRPSIHSIDWTPSTGSKPTPGSSTKGPNSTERKRQLQPYQIQRPQTDASPRFSQVFSTPNLRSDIVSESDSRSRRSHSATAIGLPKMFPISPLRLPSLTTHDNDGVPWSQAINESLRLSQFPVPPRHINPEASETISDPKQHSKESYTDSQGHEGASLVPCCHSSNGIAAPSARAVEIRVQQPTSIISPRPSTSVRGVPSENAPPSKDEDEEDHPRHSVHLHNMRISHHLRSGSLLSWDQLADAPDLPTPPPPFRERTVSDQSQYSHMRRELARHERQTSSSGFSSSKLPSKWGRVLLKDCDLRPDVASSIYSSRPQSPPDSFDGSMLNLSRTSTGHHTFSMSSTDIKKANGSNSLPSHQDTPGPAQQDDTLNIERAQDSIVESPLLVAPHPLARKNSVAETKVSKFREEFSPSPPKKKLVPSTSIMKLLNSKRLSMRSQSEANMPPDPLSMAMDGPSDTIPIPVDRERHGSMMSLQTEQEALGKNKGINHVWDRALAAHQEEKASLFLPKNRDLAVHASPFRERSASISAKHTTGEEDIGLDDHAVNTVRPRSASLVDPPSPGQLRSESLLEAIPRRSALTGRGDISPGREVSNAFEKQGDSIEVVGAWGRYPSHTRHDRILSARKVDRVDTRDFALEAAIKFASAKDEKHDDDLIDPIERLPSPPLLPGQKKKKKKVGSGRMAKSNSMTFGKTFLKNYSKIFKSQSAEFRKHGRGHRSSIASGGTLEFPELELLPDVWTGGANGDGSAEPHDRSFELVERQLQHRNSDVKGKGKLREEDSMATLRPRRNSSAPNLNDLSFHDGAGDSEHATDRARVWSHYYENCVPSFPRLSTEADFGIEAFSEPARLSLDSKRAYIHSRIIPMTMARHSRNASQLSRVTNASRRSARPSFISLGDDGAGEEQSMVSVRRSTMDLISKFKEQELVEHERVMALIKVESRTDRENIAVS
ncbi:uncharacterized protein K460DRAFT_2621 [Cucurbitaria berberidis CBS 394.84]|uniref:Uncharacterized protein n=1 Tax=Cucurbitaria berberidis CBS 394.84 TaxID=1168544 RepID=A0A9P4GNH7_9PLEO|nr:uncharacterized protein K460DRAFT_2621 [Cucurbitaria berberidis CBS 394.84]KAF1849723.1 hypothetical protein K460DRAFT_2621 [Cucurbitaria berberidis CBS 394.84]